jgi:hypothetical protein
MLLIKLRVLRVINLAGKSLRAELGEVEILKTLAYLEYACKFERHLQLLMSYELIVCVWHCKL